MIFSFFLSISVVFYLLFALFLSRIINANIFILVLSSFNEEINANKKHKLFKVNFYLF